MSKKYYICIVGLFVILGYHFMNWPVIGYDTDLWYHLSGGRYFFENFRIASNSFFSYISPAREWYNYYWLSQVVFYLIYDHCGYFGLIALRCILFLLTICFLYRLLIRTNQNEYPVTLSLVFFIAATLALTGRELVIRPHLFSYLFMIVFLYILEQKRDKVWILPPLSILWCNLHGITYPVMILILISYLIGEWWKEYRRITDGKKTFKWFLIASLYSVFLTPGWTKLLAVPFDSAFGDGRFQYLYISELKPILFQRFYNLSFYPASNFLATIQSLLVIASIIAFILCLKKRTITLPHVLIFLGAIFLLTRHNRFIYDYIILTIPLLCIGIKTLYSETTPSAGWKRGKIVFIFLLLIGLPLIVYHDYFKDRMAYPVGNGLLPTGVAACLNDLNTGGKIMNEPNTGGYLQWALNPTYRIFMDLQMSLFNDLDYATEAGAFTDEYSFKKFVAAYDPSYLSVSQSNMPFHERMSQQDIFIPIFLDGCEVLYVNKNHYPEIAEKMVLKLLHPARYMEIDLANLDEVKLNLLELEARNLSRIHPGNMISNATVCNILNVRKKHREALPFAETIVQQYPEWWNSYILRGDAYYGLGRYEEARNQYKIALNKAKDEERNIIYRNLAKTLIQLKKYKEVYDIYFKFVNPFSSSAGYKDIYDLATVAAAIGRLKDAHVFLNIASQKLPPTDTIYADKIKQLRLDLNKKQANQNAIPLDGK